MIVDKLTYREYFNISLLLTSNKKKREERKSDKKMFLLK